MKYICYIFIVKSLIFMKVFLVIIYLSHVVNIDDYYLLYLYIINTFRQKRILYIINF